MAVTTPNTILDGFYEEVMARITTQVPGIKHFDLFDDQYSNPEVDKDGNIIGLPFGLPATFFQWPGNIALTPIGLKRKVADINFNLHHVFQVVQEITKREADAVRAKAHQHLDTLNLVQKAIEGFSGGQGTNFKHFGTISLVGLEPYKIMGPYIIHVQTYKVRIVMDAAKQFFTNVGDLTPPVTLTDNTTYEII